MIITVVMLLHYYCVLALPREHRARWCTHMKRQTPSQQAFCFLRNGFTEQHFPNFGLQGSVSPQIFSWKIPRPSSLTSSGDQLHITYHGLLDRSLETNGYREFSLTFVAWAMASVESWSSFQGSCSQNSLYPLVRDMAYSTWVVVSTFFCAVCSISHLQWEFILTSAFC